MNKQQRNQWEQLVNRAVKSESPDILFYMQDCIVAANAYIMKLERELQNLKGGRKIAAILKSKVVN